MHNLLIAWMSDFYSGDYLLQWQQHDRNKVSAEPEWTPSLNGLSEHSTYSPPPNLYFLKRTNMLCQLVLTYSLDNAFGIIIRNQSNTICLSENQRMCLIMQIIWSKHLVRALSISCIANTTSYWTLWNVSFECKKVCLK